MTNVRTRRRQASAVPDRHHVGCAGASYPDVVARTIRVCPPGGLGVFVVALWVMGGGITGRSDTAGILNDTGRFTGLLASYLPHLAAIGHKVVLGTDFPSIPYPYVHQLDALAALGLGDDWMRSVLHDNAARLLGHPSR